MNIDESARPVRAVEWYEEEDGRITLKILKFKSRFGKWLCRTLKRPPHFFHPLDEKGSFIWKLCDGTHTVACILEKYENTYGEETLKKLENTYGREKIEELKKMGIKPRKEEATRIYFWESGESVSVEWVLEWVEPPKEAPKNEND